eukprot:7077744-Alexandrium_andersonii.AAC.1
MGRASTPAGVRRMVGAPLGCSRARRSRESSRGARGAGCGAPPLRRATVAGSSPGTLGAPVGMAGRA